MVTNQVLLVPWVILHAFVIVYILEDNLTEAVEVSQIGHLMVKKSVHKGSSFLLIVDLETWLIKCKKYGVLNNNLLESIA